MQLIVGIKNQPTKNKNYAATKRYIACDTMFCGKGEIRTHTSLFTRPNGFQDHPLNQFEYLSNVVRVFPRCHKSSSLLPI